MAKNKKYYFSASEKDVFTKFNTDHEGVKNLMVDMAFHRDTSGTHIVLPNTLSRKRQIVPPLSEAAKRISQQ